MPKSETYDSTPILVTGEALYEWAFMIYDRCPHQKSRQEGRQAKSVATAKSFYREAILFKCRNLEN